MRRKSSRRDIIGIPSGSSSFLGLSCTSSRVLKILLWLVIICCTVFLFTMQHTQFQRVFQRVDVQLSNDDHGWLSLRSQRSYLRKNLNDGSRNDDLRGISDLTQTTNLGQQNLSGDERQFMFDASMIERKDDQVIRKESISYTHKIQEKKMDQPSQKSKTYNSKTDDSQIPKVAFMFITKGVIHNEPSWRAFFEAAGRLSLRKQPPDVRFDNVEDLYGQLHPPQQTLREDQYPGWKILHGIIDPMTFKFLDLEKDIPAYQLAELIVDPIRYNYNVIRDADRVTRKQILRLITSFRGQMVKAQRSQSTQNQAILFPDLIANHNYTLKELLNRFDILENNNTLVSEQEYYIDQFVQLVRSMDPREFRSGKEVYESQSLFSLYVHPLSGYFFPKGSLFEGRELLSRVNTSRAFAQHAMVEAEITLLREALRDKYNQKFVLLSENCVPLRTPEVVWAQLMSESLSRVDACRHDRGPLNLYRWKKQMRTDSLSKKHWRKSQQWFVLNRAHTELVVRDQHVAEMFKRYCWSYYDPIYKSQHVCISDEHVIPTLLGTYGLDFETDCQGVGTFTDWKRGGWHPHTYSNVEIKPRMFREARGSKPECNSQFAIDSARSMFNIDLSVLETDDKHDPKFDKQSLDHQEQMIASMQARVQNMIDMQQQKTQFQQQQQQSGSGRGLLIREDGIVSGGDDGYASGERVRMDDTYNLENQQTNNTQFHNKDHYYSNAEKMLVDLMNRQQGTSMQTSQLGRNDPSLTTADVLQQDYLQQVQDMFQEQQKQMLQGDIPEEQKAERMRVSQQLPQWVIEQGYIPFGQECSLFARKFPPQSTIQTLKVVLDCEGVGLGPWCYQNWVEEHS
eukprot:TRINITY_DN1995_c0_g2_i3.p1 TRINITY_DN1995_c0_g2~~TRINITY_DN1995_c0_g2_i3.p1  ORF type:complete len:915 (-),score=66.80 TRINITY_DN1995_c0_g2_i3:1189-3741(-)